MMIQGIVRNKGILGGVPIVKGTRISVSAVLSQLQNAHGSGKHVREMYPQLTQGQIDDVLEYARRIIDEKESKNNT